MSIKGTARLISVVGSELRNMLKAPVSLFAGLSLLGNICITDKFGAVSLSPSVGEEFNWPSSPTVSPIVSAIE